ncbi:MAG: hypothetical protein NT120_03655 [Candidatus Aenigmarchaeota archaeon]|nr:hypothetical protein [Candidatus Aenigmarchaeota archaeon]
MAKVDCKKAGITLGIFVAILHIAWSFVVAIGLGQWAADFVLSLHFISMTVKVTAFNPATAIGLVVLALIGGFIMGWILAYVWNWADKRK